MYFPSSSFCFLLIIFFFNDTATTEIYTLSLHDALPIYSNCRPATGFLCHPGVDLQRCVATELFVISTSGRSRLCDLWRSEEHTSELQSQSNLVCRLLLEKKKNYRDTITSFCIIYDIRCV